MLLTESLILAAAAGVISAWLAWRLPWPGFANGSAGGNWNLRRRSLRRPTTDQGVRHPCRARCGAPPDHSARAHLRYETCFRRPGSRDAPVDRCRAGNGSGLRQLAHPFECPRPACLYGRGGPFGLDSCCCHAWSCPSRGCRRSDQGTATGIALITTCLRRPRVPEDLTARRQASKNSPPLLQGRLQWLRPRAVSCGSRRELEPVIAERVDSG